MSDSRAGRILAGDADSIHRACDRLAAQDVDQDWSSTTPDNTITSNETTLGESFPVSGSGTFLGKAQRTLHFAPTQRRGWWFDRSDLPGQMAIGVSVNNVWTTARNIVLSSGSPHNYMRMVEHIVALKVGMGLDNVVIRMDSGDPPLFDRSSMDLVEGVEKAGIIEQDRPATVLTVKEPVSVVGRGDSFLTFLPAENKMPTLKVDCAVDFPSAIGKQRIRFIVNRDTFRHGALARTNTPLSMMIYCKTIGKIFADVRNLGYTTRNILVAGPHRYFNQPGLIHNGRSLEAAWHRATLDLLAVVALIDRGRFAGTIISYKAGHSLDVEMIRHLYEQDLLCEL